MNWLQYVHCVCQVNPTRFNTYDIKIHLTILLYNLLSDFGCDVWFISVTALSGNYVNFGVFELYGDRALVDALDVALKMILVIPLAEILAYPKVWVLFSSFPT